MTATQCDSCESIRNHTELITPIPDLDQRVDPGAVVPAGECPDCGALAYLLDDAGQIRRR